MSAAAPGDDAAALDALAEEYVERLRRGESPDLEDYARGNPQHAAKIRRLFPLLSVMEGVSESTAGARGSAAGGPAPREGSADPAAPQRIGPYRVVRALGTGGMGRVYEGRSPVAGAGAEPVAIKVIHPHLVTKPDYVARFLREVRAGRRVSHPNLVRTLDAGALELDGVETPYLVLEYVEGQTLRALLREVGEVPERLCRHIGVRVADALAAIHAEGIVHRDIKPENILITTGEVIKVMDLGVALLQDEALRISRTGDFVGSLLYAAPEQLDGRTPDGRADLYALGRVLFEFVCGRLPPRHDSPDADWARAGASPFLGAVLRRLLAPDREQRLPEALQLRDILRAGERGAWWRKRSREQRLAPSAWQALGFERPTGFHGREEELRVLSQALAEARGGRGRVVLVEGEAGAGKSRLLYEWAARCDESDPDVRIVVARHGPGAGTGESAPLAAALVGELGEDALNARIAEALGARSPLANILREQVRGGPGAPAAEPGVVPTAWLRLLRALAEDGPLVLAFEDLHFGDDEVADLFRSLAAGIRRHAIVLVGSTRPVEGERALSLENLEHAERLLLAGLDATHCRALVREAWGGPRPPEFASQLIRQSDGNPFFLLELVRALRQRIHATGADTTTALRAAEIPSSVRSLIEAQLARLDAEDRELVQAGACVGFEFDPVLVADVAEIPHVAALRRFGRLERARGLLAAEGSRYRFRHHLVQETLYRETHPRLREAYHAAIGRALMARAERRGVAPEDLPGEEAVRLWHHLFQGGMAERATAFLVPALEHHSRRGAFSRAYALGEEALAVPGLLRDEARVHVLTHVGRSLRFHGRFEEAASRLDEALRLADLLDLYPSRASVRALLAFVATRLGQNERCVTLYEEAAAIARDAGDPARAAMLQAYIADRHLNDDRVDEAHELCRASLEALAGHEEAVAELDVRDVMGRIATARGDLDAARSHLERAAELAHQGGYRASETAIVISLGGLAFRRGDFTEAQAHCLAAMELSEELGLVNRAVNEKTKYALCLLERGCLEDAHRVAREALDDAARNDWASELGTALTFVARAEASLGLWEAALESVRRALAAMPRGARQALHLAARTEAEVLGWVGRQEEAERRLTETADEAGRLGNRQGESHLLALQGRLAEQRGRPEEAARLLEAAYAMRTQGGSLHGAIPLDLGRVLARLGRHGEGRQLMEAARDWAHDGGAEGLEARARIHLALLPGEDPLAARLLLEQHEARLARHERVETHLALWEATGDPQALASARDHLRFLVEHAPEEDRGAMLAKVDLLRRVQAAGPGA